MFNRETHKSRGFGFIVFELEKGADAVCAIPEHTINGKEVRELCKGYVVCLGGYSSIILLQYSTSSSAL